MKARTNILDKKSSRNDIVTRGTAAKTEAINFDGRKNLLDSMTNGTWCIITL